MSGKPSGTGVRLPNQDLASNCYAESEKNAPRYRLPLLPARA
jgi:hypothetical protein